MFSSTTDEANILYVATPRAKERLFLTDAAYEFFNQSLKKAFGRIILEIQEMSSRKDLSGTRKQLLADWEKLKATETPIHSVDDIPIPPEDKSWL